ncbi:hypothetical protein ACHAXS_010067 [Conticribra weissflogii]
MEDNDTNMMNGSSSNSRISITMCRDDETIGIETMQPMDEACQRSRRRKRSRRLPTSTPLGMGTTLALLSASLSCSLPSLTLATTTTTTTSTRGASTATTTTTTTKKNDCPAGFTGRKPTAGCAGYVDCQSGRTTNQFECGKGTIYDAALGICNWPSGVTCAYEEPEQEEDVADDPGEEEAHPPNPCPPRYTGRTPSANCKGYVYCHDGQPGLSSKCPPQTLFHSLSMTCMPEQTVHCQYLTDPPADAEAGVEIDVQAIQKYGGLSAFCPAEHSGRVPTTLCGGYVDCVKGAVPSGGMGVRYCASGMKFDVMSRSCTDDLGDGFVCEALHVGPDTLDDADDSGEEDAGGKDVGKPRIVVPDGCPPDHTGYAPKAGCTKYVYCVAGKESGLFSCGAGTLFDVKVGYCNWKDSVECATSSPSYAPTLSPIAPTTSPTESPTKLDLKGVLYYPNFMKGVCTNDGKQPPGISRQFLFSSAHGCCSAIFATNYDKCVQFTAPKVTEVPSAAPSGGGEKEWYPDYENGGCLNDGEFSEWEVNFFRTYRNCECHMIRSNFMVWSCKFIFDNFGNDFNTCMALKPGPPTTSPTESVKYYPDYTNNLCLNDGLQSPYETKLFDSFEECCKYEWVDYDICIKYPPGTPIQNNDVMAWWYPDFQSNICRSDGQHSEFQVNLFPTRQECCEFPWIDYDTCINALEDEYIDHGNEWYPDARKGYCVNDGYPPSNIVTSESFDICCLRYYSADLETCKLKSQGIGLDVGDGDGNDNVNDVDLPQDGWYPDYDATACFDDGYPPDGVSLSATFRLCCTKFFPGSRHECYSNSAPDTRKPTRYPTPDPTQAPTNRPTRPKRTKNPTPSPFVLMSDSITSEPTPDPTPEPTRGLTPKPTPSPTHNPTAKPTEPPKLLWYPDISTSRCLKNPQYIPPMVPSFESYQTCCNYAWIVYVDDCLADAETKANVFYPDYFAGFCRNDGRQSPYEKNVFPTAKACCLHPSMDYALCMEKFEYPNGKVYYPDYFFSICRHDGKQSLAETNLFTSLQDCCGIEWLDTGNCLANSPS